MRRLFLTSSLSLSEMDDAKLQIIYYKRFSIWGKMSNEVRWLGCRGGAMHGHFPLRHCLLFSLGNTSAVFNSYFYLGHKVFPQFMPHFESLLVFLQKNQVM